MFVQQTESEHGSTRTVTRRRVAAAGAKLAYTAPLVAASMKLAARGAEAAISGGFCGHSTGPNGGCKGACAAAGFTGNQCNRFCGNGQFVGACPVGQGGGNPCCNAGYCDPANFRRVGGQPAYVGPTPGCR
jgi:hypothetical protein